MNRIGRSSRTSEYGTVLEVEVVTVEEVGSTRILAVGKLPYFYEAFILLETAKGVAPLVGDRGTITFFEGGPTGGHWKYSGTTREGQS